MISLTSLSDLDGLEFDAIIDVRSPVEFSEDHIPGAISLPVLDNEERARVGTIYKQDSPFRARKVGAALVFRNAAAHIESVLAGHNGGWRPLIYCWRGGQRSGAFAWMLKEIGWRAETIEGGYKSFRRLVVRALYDDPLPHRLVLLCGYTGTAKTALLSRVAALGVQVLDLENLAHHRGSLLGEMDQPQPSQKAFESALAMELSRFDPNQPVLVEAESSKIGARSLPPSVWSAMCQAQLISVEAPLEARALYLSEAYADVLADKIQLKGKLDVLRRHRGHAVVDRWNELIDAGDNAALCQALVTDHYDPAYDSSIRRAEDRIVAHVRVDALAPKVLDETAARIAQEIQRIST